MKFKTGLIAILLIAVVLTLNIPFPQAQANTQDELNQAQEESARLKRELEATQSKKYTLAEEVARLNNLARLNELEIQDTQGQIQDTQNQIVQANSEISELNDRLDNLIKSMEQTQQAANARLRESYKKSRTSNLATIITSHDFQAMLRNLEYLQRTKEEDTRILTEMAETKKSYLAEKSNLEKLKKEKESLQARFEQEKALVQSKQAELVNTKNEQASLLSITQNDESRYAQMLAQNEARIASMRAILSGGLTSGRYLGRFRKGEVIGYEGAAGCVYPRGPQGSHLHFSIVRNGGFQNPWNYLGQVVNGIDYGYPHDGYSAYITQGYFGAHNGVDTSRGMGSPLVATADGDAYFHIAYTINQINAAGWCPSDAKPALSNQNEIWLKHADGTISLYAHVSGAVTK